MELSSLIQNILLPLGDKLTGSSFIHELKKLRQISKLDSSELKKLHEEKLMTLMSHAKTKIPYYSKLEFEINTKLSPQENLKNFPILNKSTLKENTEDMLSERKENLIRNASSGSTGQQSIVYWSKKEQSINRATQILWWEWAGYTFGNPLLQTGITPNRGLVKSIKDKLLNTYYLQAFTHTKDDVKAALIWASKQKEPVLAGYSSSLFVIASYAEELGIEVKFKTAISWGDKMFDHYRSKIETIFQTIVHETYGSAEGLMMGAQKDLNYMYMMNSNVHIEILDDDNNEVKDGEIGNIIVTNLNGFAMPLIRYRVGDLGIKLPKEHYPTKTALHFPQWQKIIGRDTDLVKTKSGKFMVVHSFTGIFEHIPQIKQFCVIQNDYNGIEIQYIPGDGFEPILLKHAKSKILEYLKEDFQIDFQEVETILPTKSGKPQLIISRLK